jgi:hypothetical protein
MNEDRPIEKLLRRAAEKRNAEAGAPPELHPANRRMLQAEVAKQFPQSGPAAAAPARSFWFILSQRWSFAIGIFIVLAIAAFALWPMLSKDKSQDQLSKLSAKDESVMSGEALSEAVMPAAQPVVPVAFDTEAGQTTLSGGGNLAVISPSSVSPATATAEYFSRDGAAENVARSIAAQSATDLSAQPLTRTSRAQEPAVRSLAFGADRQNLEMDTRSPAPGRRTTELEDSARYRSATPPTVVTEEKAKVSEAVTPPRPAAIPNYADAEAPTENVASTVARGPEPQPTATIESRSDIAVGQLRLGSASGAPASNRVAGGAGGREQFYAGRTEPLNQPAASDAIFTNVGAIANEGWIARGGGEETPRAVANSQMFSNVDLKAAALAKKESSSAPPTPVLVNFKVEQAGQFLRVIDGDGSVYRGYVDEANTLYKQVIAQKEQAVAQQNQLKVQSPRDASANNLSRQQATELYLYRVEGTNRSLNQNVVFSWNFMPTNEAIAAAQMNYKDNLLKVDATQLPSQLPEVLQNSFINGRAQLGEGREFEINAVPVKP